MCLTQHSPTRSRISYISTILVYTSDEYKANELKQFKKDICLMEAVRRRNIRLKGKMKKAGRIVREYQE